MEGIEMKSEQKTNDTKSFKLLQNCVSNEWNCVTKKEKNKTIKKAIFKRMNFKPLNTMSMFNFQPYISISYFNAVTVEDTKTLYLLLA